MPVKLKRLALWVLDPNTRAQNLTSLLCVLFGVAMIANTQTAGDGGWYWYALFFRSGRHLYSDMHLVLQPLFVLETSAFLGLLGKGWLASKVPAVLHVLAYCIGLALVARQSRLADRHKALVLACVFFVSIDFEAYRFDDYHVLADCFTVYSLALLLALPHARNTMRASALALTLGVLSGLSLMTRLNDGAALCVGVALAILALAPARRILPLALYGLAAAITAIATVHLTGDTLRDYAQTSIFHAAGSKGGAGSVLAYPLQLPWSVINFLRVRQNLGFTLYCLGSALLWAVLIRPFFTAARRPLSLLKLLLGVAAVALPLHHFRASFAGPQLIVDLSAVGVLLVYALGIAVFLRYLRWQFASHQDPAWNRREILLVIPLGQLASASMSSGGRHIGLYAPIALMVLLLPIASPLRLRTGTARAFAFAVAAILTVHCAAYKYRYPYLWHSYVAHTMFVGRQWYRHPEYGPMVIEREELKFILPLCNAVRPDAKQQGLLSLPLSYPNYFCSVPPWHGYVQTFFDTSSSETIYGLMDQLQRSPPTWIAYQRQLNNLALHERIFNQGRPLPQRFLDRMIEDKIASGEWKPVYTSTYGSSGFYTNEWVLLRTRP